MSNLAQHLTLKSMRDKVTPAEWQARVDLAACYRLVAHYEMSDMMANHISAAVPGEGNAFLINAYGMLYEEITASSLIKIDIDGNILAKPDFGALDYGINRAGYVIHGAIHKARHDVACVIHTHTWAGMALSALECGVLPITQTAMRWSRVAYHDFEGIALDLDERSRLVRDLGPHHAMILRNHGLLTCGRTVAEAFMFMYVLERVCRSQLAMMAAGGAIRLPPPEVCEKTALQYSCNRGEPAGVHEWPHWVRMMDRLDPSYRS